jgi:thioredoxin 1
MASANISNTSDSAFGADVVDTSSSVPVVVDLWATWCAPCKAMNPLLEAVADEFGPKVKVVKLDIQANPKTAQQFGVASIPTLLVFRNGQVVDRLVGNPGTKQKLRDFVAKQLPGA